MLVASLFAAMVTVAAVPLLSPPADRPAPTAVDHPSPDSTAVLIGRARALARLGQGAEAMRIYHAAALRADGADEWALFRRDLALVAAPSELTLWDRATPATRPAMILAFWSDRDARDSLPEGGRFVEHVRRVDVALAEYRVQPKRGKMPLVRTSASGGADRYDRAAGIGSPIRDYVPAQGEIDDRGVIYVRHGAPDARRLGAGTLIESWIYERASGPLVVYFTESLFDGSSGNTALVAAPPITAYASVCDFDRAACTMSARLTEAPVEQRERLRQHTLAAIRELTTTDRARTP
jgi:hypothetical protein